MRYRLRYLPPLPDPHPACWTFRAGVAQLAERDPSKVDVAGSIPVSRSNRHRRPTVPERPRVTARQAESGPTIDLVSPDSAGFDENQLPNARAQSAAAEASHA